MGKKKVIVAGHICLDITPVFPKNKIKKVSEILQPGKLIQMGAADVHTGGAVANTGLAMKFLGADVSLMGKIGTDAFGDMIINILKKHGAEKGMIRDAESTTSYSVVLAMPGIDRIFLHHPGANDTFVTEDIVADVSVAANSVADSVAGSAADSVADSAVNSVADSAVDSIADSVVGEVSGALEEPALFHFGYPPIMKKMYENDGDELVKLMKTVKEAGVSTSLDLAAVDAESEAGQADWNEILKKTLPYVDFFAPSVEELCFMIDRPRYEAWQQRYEDAQKESDDSKISECAKDDKTVEGARGSKISENTKDNKTVEDARAGKSTEAGGISDITEILDLEHDIKPLADKCMEYGCKVLLIKCGAPGIYFKTAGEDKLSQISERVGLDVSSWSDKSWFEKSYVPDCILSGTGAGDTSIAAFLTAMLEGYTPERCLQLMTATGASCVTAYDSLSGLKTFDELIEKIDKGWKKC